MNLKYATIPLLVAALSGCNVSSEDIKQIIDDAIEQPNNDNDSDGEGGTPPTSVIPPQPFNLTDVSANTSNSLRFSWSGDADGMTYTVCFKDTSLPYNCDERAIVHGVNSADVVGVNSLSSSVGDYFILAENAGGKALSSESSVDKNVADSLIEYIKASVSESGDRFGTSIALSADGAMLAVGAVGYVDGARPDLDVRGKGEGAVYVFKNQGDKWVQEAHLKASNFEFGDDFGRSVSLSADGTVLAVGADKERSSSTGINGDQSDNSFTDSGAVYVFRYDGSNWAQEAYVKPSNTESDSAFGWSVSLSDDGSLLAVGAYSDDYDAIGVNYALPVHNGKRNSGSVYVFRHDGLSWIQDAYIKASNPDIDDSFGKAISLSGDGVTLAVGALYESSSATGVNGNSLDNSSDSSGAVYVFRHDGLSWAQEAYIKASNAELSDEFGGAVALNGDGSVLAVGAASERSSSSGVNGNQMSNSFRYSGAAYVFRYDESNWMQEAYFKASNTGSYDLFGSAVSLSDDGSILAVGAKEEESSSRGINGEQTNDDFWEVGAVYLYRHGIAGWAQESYVKPTNSYDEQHFGGAVSISGDGLVLAVGSERENSSSSGVNGDQDQDENYAESTGAVYVYD